MQNESEEEGALEEEERGSCQLIGRHHRLAASWPSVSEEKPKVKMPCGDRSGEVEARETGSG
jgi:hypothetical protein